MRDNGNLIRVILAITIVSAPALAARVLSEYYDVQYMQPLAVTKESVAAFEEATEGDGFTVIDVHVAWGEDRQGSLTKEDLRERISATLIHQTEFFRFDFNDLPGQDIEVTFNVGPNSYGPFPPNQMAQGIKSALVALKMTNGPES